MLADVDLPNRGKYHNIPWKCTGELCLLLNLSKLEGVF